MVKAFSVRRDYEPLDRRMRDLVRVLRLSKSIPADERERRLMRLIREGSVKPSTTQTEGGAVISDFCQ